MSTVIFLSDEEPRFCPGCGRPIRHQADWYAHASMICAHCPTHYQRAEAHHLLAAATAAGGDLARYVH